MPGCFMVNAKGEIKVTKEAKDLIPDFAKLTEPEFHFIVLVEDMIYSPFHRMNRKDRISYAKVIVWGDDQIKIEKKDSHLLKCMEYYKSLVYDERRETVSACREKISSLSEVLRRPSLTDASEINNLMKSITALQIVIDNNEKELLQDEHRIILKGKQELSLLEKMKRSRELYKKAKL